MAGGVALAGDVVVGQRAAFASRVSVLGVVAAWMTFGINEVYAVLSGIGFLREGAAVESGPFLSVMALLVVLMGPFLVLSMAAVHAFADPSRRIYGLAALGFMVACVTVTSCVNFLLLLVSVAPELFSESWRVLFPSLPVAGARVCPGQLRLGLVLRGVDAARRADLQW